MRRARRTGGSGLLMLAISCLSAQAADNNVHLHGALVAEPCVIPPGEESIPLDFGSVVAKYLYLHGRTAGQGFSIHLADCDPSIAKTVRVTFSGTQSTALPGLLAPDPGSTATGIAIGLETPTGQAVPLETPSDKTTLIPGDTHITLQAYVRGEPDAIAHQSITEGTFSAVAAFHLEYE